VLVKERRRVYRVNAVDAVAELAGDLDDALLGEHGIDLLAAERAQQALDALARAAAPERDRLGVEEPHALLVEQAVEQGLGRQPQELRVAQGVGEHDRARPGIVFHAGARQALQQQARSAAASAASHSRVGSCSDCAK